MNDNKTLPTSLEATPHVDVRDTMNHLNARIADYKNDHFHIHQIRNEVFIDEQKVSKELEIDGQDDKAIHVLVSNDNEPIGTGRMLPDGHIGRMAVKKSYRNQAIGKMIMEKLLEAAMGLDLSEVWLSSQCHAKSFYHKFGFIEFGDVYEDANIDHINMKKEL